MHYKIFSLLHSVSMLVIHVHKFGTLYLWYGGQRSTWGHLGSHGSNLDFHQKCFISPLCYIVYSCNPYRCISLRPSITFSESGVNLGSQGLLSHRQHGMSSVTATCLVFLSLLGVSFAYKGRIILTTELN